MLNLFIHFYIYLVGRLLASLGTGKAEEEKEVVSEEAGVTENSVTEDTFPVPYWAVFDNTHMWFIFQEFKGFSFKLQPTAAGVNVVWTMAEPTENMLQSWGVPTRVIHTQLASYHRLFFVSSQYPLMIQCDMISVIKSPNYHVLKIMVQVEEEDGVLEF